MFVPSTSPRFVFARSVPFTIKKVISNIGVLEDYDDGQPDFFRPSQKVWQALYPGTYALRRSTGT